MNIKILAQNIINNPNDFTAEQIENYFEEYANFRKFGNKRRSQIQLEISNILYQINSRYGIFGNVEPTDNQILEMYNKIKELREELKNIK